MTDFILALDSVTIEVDRLRLIYQFEIVGQCTHRLQASEIRLATRELRLSVNFDYFLFQLIHLVIEISRHLGMFKQHLVTDHKLLLIVVIGL